MLGNYRSQDAPQIVELLFYHQRNENSSGERPTDALRRRRIANKGPLSLRLFLLKSRYVYAQLALQLRNVVNVWNESSLKKTSNCFLSHPHKTNLSSFYIFSL